MNIIVDRQLSTMVFIIATEVLKMRQIYKDVLDNAASKLLLEQAREGKEADVVVAPVPCSCPFHLGGNRFGCSRNAGANDWQAVRGY